MFLIPSGKFRRTIGSLKGGEGMFKRPTGIAVDSAARRIYVTDTLRDKIFMMDMNGSVLQTIGKKGHGRWRVQLRPRCWCAEQNLFVVDAMNFRVQFLDRSGAFETAVGSMWAISAGSMFRPKGIGFDSEGHLYVVDGLWGVVQVFDQQGRLLYYFGSTRHAHWGIPAAGGIVHRSRRPYLRGGFLQPARAGIPLLRVTEAGHRQGSHEAMALLSFC